MSVALSSKPWRPLDAETIDALPAQLGVYELADASGTTLKLGYAGGREPFGMRTALLAELAHGTATQFRHEFTHGYLSRWHELLMIHRRDTGTLPPANEHDAPRIGRLTRPSAG